MEKSILNNLLKVIGKTLPKRVVAKSTFILGGVIIARFLDLVLLSTVA